MTSSCQTNEQAAKYNHGLCVGWQWGDSETLADLFLPPTCKWLCPFLVEWPCAGSWWDHLREAMADCDCLQLDIFKDTDVLSLTLK